MFFFLCDKKSCFQNRALPLRRVNENESHYTAKKQQEQQQRQSDD